MQVRNVKSLEKFHPSRLAKVNVFATPRFFCDVYCLLPGQSQKVHSHAENDKIYYVLEGEVMVTVGAESGPLRAGEIVLAPAGEPHGVENASGTGAVCLVFMAPHPGPGPSPPHA